VLIVMLYLAVWRWKEPGSCSKYCSCGRAWGESIGFFGQSKSL